MRKFTAALVILLAFSSWGCAIGASPNCEEWQRTATDATDTARESQGVTDDALATAKDAVHVAEVWRARAIAQKRRAERYGAPHVGFKGIN